MLKILGLAALSDFIGILKKEKNFFSLEAKARRELVAGHLGDYPVALAEYFQQADPDRFMAEVKNALGVFDQTAYPDSKNELLNALAHYLAEDFARQFDHLSLSFFFADVSERSKRLSQLFPGQSMLSQTARDLVFQSTYQEIGALANAALTYLKNAPVLVIQAPVELDSALRQSIRSHLLEKHPFSFPEFQVNPQIVGGMRAFVGGRVMDHSWMGRIQSLGNLGVLTK